MSGLKNGAILQNGKYKIIKTLGQGSFGITYLASTKTVLNGQLGDMSVDVNVAIKEFFMSEMSTRSTNGSAVERTGSTLVSNYKRKFVREAENLSLLKHDNIVNVLEVFEENNTAYYVMEYIDGGTVNELIKRQGKLTASQTVAIIRQVCSALQYMHANRMLHLDLKPKNIMVNSSGMVKLIDFGLSKQYTENGEPESSTSVGLGTPGYAPVEQSGYQQDGTMPVTLDVYALGATMYKMLTGIVPPESSIVLNDGLPMQPLRMANVPEDMVSIVCKAMAPMKRERYQSVIQMDTALKSLGFNEKEALESLPLTDIAQQAEAQQPTPPPYRPQQAVPPPPPPYQPQQQVPPPYRPQQQVPPPYRPQQQVPPPYRPQQPGRPQQASQFFQSSQQQSPFMQNGRNQSQQPVNPKQQWKPNGINEQETLNESENKSKLKALLYIVGAVLLALFLYAVYEFAVDDTSDTDNSFIITPDDSEYDSSSSWDDDSEYDSKSLWQD